MANSYYQSAYKGTEIDESIGKVQDIFIKKTAAIPVDVGGTGQTTIQGIKDMLGIGEDQQGVTPVANGGTGATTATDARTNLGITPANIGALATTGGTMTGDLSLKMNNPHLYMTDTTNAETNSRGSIAHGTREMQMIAYSQVGSTQNFRGLFVADAVKTPDVAQALRLSDRVNGASTYYNVLTEANAKDIVSEQITPVDIGALAEDETAAAATKLATARTIRTNLASTSTASFDGTANITPGVTGTLPISNGGTGATTAAAARTNLGITPANIGAVKTTGDTMTGDLSISSTYPKIYLTDTDEESQGSVIHSDRRTQMFAYNEAGSTLDSRGITVDAASKTSDVADALVLADRVNGITTYYNVLTEANAKDIVQELLQGGELSVVKSVQRGTQELSSSESKSTITISAVDIGKALVVAHAKSPTGRSAYTTASYEARDFYTAGAYLQSGTELVVTGGSEQGSTTIYWQVIEFY